MSSIGAIPGPTSQITAQQISHQPKPVQQDQDGDNDGSGAQPARASGGGQSQHKVDVLA